MSDYDWDSVRAQFNLDPEYTHLGSTMYVASHPRPVRESIERYRDILDRNPVKFISVNEMKENDNVRKKAAAYLEVEDPKHIALTDSTTMGLGTIYTGLNIGKEHELLMNEHNYYSHLEAAKRAAERTGAGFREIKQYEDIGSVTEEELVDNVIKEIKDQTVVVGASWVYSNTGLKMPLAKLAKQIARINKHRDEGYKILLIVDGVQAFGVERETFKELGCAFLITGCHKWIYGPRGTGIIVATDEAWQTVFPVIPEFEENMYRIIAGKPRPERMNGLQMSPGGFHSHEHRWALAEAFDFIEGIGKKRIYDRVHELARLVKEGLAEMPHVTVATPMSDDLSAGIVSFNLNDYTAKEAVQSLMKKKIVCSEAPYKQTYVRFSPGIYNTQREVQHALDAVNSLKQGK